MRFSRPTLSLVLLSLLTNALGCSNTPSSGPVRPMDVNSMMGTLSQVTLPSALAHDPSLSVATFPESPVIVGGKSGLFTLTASGASSQVTGNAVTGMATIAGAGVFVATSAGLELWNGVSLVDSGLDGQMGGARALAVAARGSQLWIGTTGALFILDSGVLVSLPNISGVSAIQAAASADDVVTTSTSGIIAVRDVSGTFTTHALSGELSAQLIVPGGDDTLFALSSGALEERVSVDAENAAWRPFALSTSPSDPGAKGVQALSVSPSSAAVWVLAGDTLASISGSGVSVATPAPSFGTPEVVRATLDGTLWVSDGTTLFSFFPAPSTSTTTADAGASSPDGGAGGGPGDGGITVTYTNDIAPFSQNNCERCHSTAAGVAFPLSDYSTWVSNIDTAIFEVSEKLMPKDGAALVGGNVTLLENWKAQGLQQ